MVLKGLALVMRPLQFLLYWVVGYLPREECWWVFGSWSGKRKGDNSGALFRYVAALDDGPRVTWISAERKIVRELEAAGYDARYRYSPSGVWACVRGGVFLFDGLTRDINHWLSRGTKRVLLRHGVGIKRIERGITNPEHRLYKLFRGRWWQRLGWSIAIPWHLVVPTLALATSEEHARQAVACFGITRDQVLITGFPRHDALLRDVDVDALETPEKETVRSMRSQSRPVFLFMPTFRETADYMHHIWDKLNSTAERANVQIFVKLHLVDSLRHSDMADKINDRWPYLTWVDEMVEPTLVYGSADGLITDYSSAAFDAMLINLPIVYFVPDLQDFQEKRPFFGTFEESSPGPKCATYDDLASTLVALDSQGLGDWKDQYQEVRDRFHKYQDAGSSERAFRQIKAAIHDLEGARSRARRFSEL